MIVPIPQFTAPAYNDRTLNNVQRMQNWFPEKTPEGWKLVSYPGFQSIGTVANNAGCRGSYFSTSGKLFTVNGNTVYEVLIDGSSTSRGTISTSSGPVYFADNGTQLFLVVQDTNGYALTMASGSMTLISDGNFPTNPIGAAFIDGYFVTCQHRTGLFYLSQLLDGTDWTPLQFATAEYAGDALYDVKRIGSRLYFFGTRSIEPWYSTGNASFPFERVTGAAIDLGVSAISSVGLINGVAYFVGSSQAGRGSVYSIGGAGMQKISTPYIESLLANFADANEGYCYSLDGHAFYEINNSNGGGTFVYDIESGAWFERIPAGTTPTIFRPIINAFSQLGAAPFAFNSANGSVYSVGPTYNSNAGTAITRARIFGPISSETKRVFHSQIRIELDMAFDATGATTIAPTLDWSDDGGLTWSAAITLTKTVANTTTGQRVILTANRLGSSAERFYRLTGPNSAAKFILKKCEIDLKEGRF